jgi:hypothetical protein
MQSWASEFGYELIENDWDLDFQPPDLHLAELVRQEVETARERQKRLANAAPRRYKKSRPAQYRVSPTRGGVILDQPPLGSEDVGFRPRQSVASPGAHYQPNHGSGHNRGKSLHSLTEEDMLAERPADGQQSISRKGGRTSRPDQQQPGETSASKSSAPNPKGRHTESLAARRGRDWALPDAASGSVAITRPISLECHPDRLIIPPKKGFSRSRSIQLGPRTEESIDELVSAVWERMQSWGIAGNGMYWSPTLDVHVVPGAEQRFFELSTLLEDSGLGVSRKTEGH